MNLLLFTDPHFSDNPIESYRWEIFTTLKQLITQYKVSHLFCLGDLVDRKDRHTGALVNRLVDMFSQIECAVSIIAGNHDKPLSGPYYWEFLNKSHIQYITKPFLFIPYLYALPYTPNPIQDWKDLNFNSIEAIFIHQTVVGALIEGDRKLQQGQILPPIPKDCMIFSGDVHRPQAYNNIVYIGAPYPVRFSESWNCRVILILDGDFKNYREIPVNSIKRDIIEINKAEDLTSLNYKEGDQLRIRYKLTGKDLTTWPVEQELIRNWTKQKGILLASLEATIVGDALLPSPEVPEDILEMLKPEDMIRQFCAQENLNDEIKEMGLTLLKEGKT
jgi:DNA repair exonuclease SbcCD nuclease subunit